MIIELSEKLPVKNQVWGVRTFDLGFSNEDTGTSQVQVNGPARLTCALVSEEKIPVMAEAAAWRAAIHALNGRVNKLAVWDFLNPVPLGTARGAWTAGATAAGATSLQISMGLDQAGKTLLKGDYIGVNQTGHRQLLHVQADATANGAGVLVATFSPALRVPVAAGSAVVWNRPTCLMRRITNEASLGTGEGRTQGGFSLDLMESWE